MGLNHNQWAVVAITATICLAGMYTIVGSALETLDSAGFEGAGDDIQAPDDETQREGQDTDEDGLSDLYEKSLGTDPEDKDSDDDGLTDGEEMNIHSSNPLLVDTDGDGHDDAKEVAANTDPNNPLSRPMPFMKPPSKAPGAPPAPDYVDTITKLTAALQEKTAQLAAHEEKDARRNKELTEANANNAELVAKVESLEAKVTSLNQQVASLSTANGELKGQVTNLREDNGNLQGNITSLNEQLVESDRIAKTPFVHGWIYTPDHGWLNINPDNFPIIYKNSTKTWHFYEQGSISPRYFYNFNEQKWEAWDSIPSGSEN